MEKTSFFRSERREIVIFVPAGKPASAPYNFNPTAMSVTAPQIPAALREAVHPELLFRHEEEIEGIACRKTLFAPLDREHFSVRNTLFAGCSFTGCVLRKSHFADVTFRNCDFSNADFAGCSFHRTEFVDCRLAGTEMPDGTFHHTLLLRCKAEYVNLSQGRFRNALFSETILRNGALAACRLERTRFDRCDLSQAEFFRTPLEGISLVGNEIGGIRIGATESKELRGCVVSTVQALELARMLGIRIEDTLP